VRFRAGAQMMLSGLPEDTAIVPKAMRQGSSGLVPGGVGSISNFFQLRPPLLLVPAITELPSSQQQLVRVSDALVTRTRGFAGVQSSCCAVISPRWPG
jgi:hypothetical protein